MKTKYILPMAFLAAGLLSSCQDDMETFDNKVFDNASEKLSTILLQGENEETRTLQAAIAMPLDHDLTVTYKADPSMVDAYNAIYSDNAIALPTANYRIDNPSVVISRGGVTSTELEVAFVNLTSLDRETTYVLPVTIADSELPILTSNRTSYFVVKGAALINVVADINQNYLELSNPGSATALGNLTQMTVEALLYPNDMSGTGHEAGISTFMGIEGYFLFRFGDAGLDPSQLQVATSNGNVTDSAWRLETGKWTFLSITYDSATGAVDVYFNGIKKGDTQYTSFRNAVDWNSNNFLIGKSYSNSRFFDGYISEARIWNRVLTPEEFLTSNYFYTVDTAANGLTAYWKFNEGAGKLVHDYVNGYDMLSNETLEWVSVELPEN
jgi:hypothetical protein